MIRLLLRRAVADAPLMLATIAVLTVTAGTIAVATQHIERMTVDGLRHAVGSAQPAERGMIARRQSTTQRLTISAAQTQGQRLRVEFAPPVRAITADADTIIDSARLEVVDPALSGRTRRVTLRTQPGYTNHARVLEGRLPRATADRLPTPSALRARTIDRQRDVAVIEVAMSAATASALQLEVGRTVIVDGDLTDPYTVRVAGQTPLVALRLTGTVVLDDPALPMWFGDRAAHTPTVVPMPGGGSVIVFATALTAPDALPELASSIAPLPLVSTWRYAVDPRRLDPSAVDDLRPALRRLEQQYVTSSYVPDGATGIRTSLGDILDRYVASLDATLRTMAVIGAGVAGVLLTVMVLLAVLRSDLRNRSRDTLRARGASSVQLLVATGIEVAVAWTIAIAVSVLVTGMTLRPAVAWATGVVAAIIMVGDLPLRQSPGTQSAPRSTTRRYVFDGTVMILAAAGAIVAGRRGVVTDDGDLFLIAVPVLTAAAAGLMVVRGLPLVIRWLSAATVGERSVAIAIGLRRFARHPNPAVAPVLAVTVATATLVLAMAAWTSVHDELDRQAWYDVGAPARIDTDGPVDGGTPAFVRPRLPVGGRDTTLLAVEPEPYADLMAGTSIVGDLAALHVDDDPLPAIASTSVGAVGTRIDISLPGVAIVPVEIRETRARFPTVAADVPFIVVPLRQLSAMVPTGITPNRWYLPADHSPQPTDVRTQAGAAAVMRSAPLPRAGLLALRVGAVLAVALGVAAAGMSLLLAARQRRRDLSYLRAIGLRRSEAAGLVVVEILPPLVVAVLIGSAIGSVQVMLFGDGLRLGVLTGGGPVAVPLDPVDPVLAAAALIVPIVIAAEFVAWRGLDDDLASTLRKDQPW